MPNNISTQGYKIIEPGMMNIYWTKIKLHNWSSDFPLVVGTSKFINFIILSLWRGVIGRFRHMPEFFWIEKVGRHFLCCPPQDKNGGTRPLPIDAHAPDATHIRLAPYNNRCIIIRHRILMLFDVYLSLKGCRRKWRRSKRFSAPTKRVIVNYASAACYASLCSS